MTPLIIGSYSFLVLSFMVPVRFISVLFIIAYRLKTKTIARKSAKNVIIR